MTDSQTYVTSEYEELCEQLFRNWLAGSIAPQGLWDGFSVDHCPEPYLDFIPGGRPLIYVTHNPGRGEAFQLRSAVDTPAGPIKSGESYRENAHRLASWYSGAGGIRISAAARNRIAAMGDLALQLGAEGVRQVESFPLHSDNADAQRLLSREMRLSGALGEYRSQFKKYLATQSVVIAISGSPTDPSGMAIQTWANAVGLELQNASFLPLKRKGNLVTVGVYAMQADAGLRVLFCCAGSNSLPARDRMPEAVRFLRELGEAKGR